MMTPTRDYLDSDDTTFESVAPVIQPARARSPPMNNNNASLAPNDGDVEQPSTLAPPETSPSSRSSTPVSHARYSDSRKSPAHSIKSSQRGVTSENDDPDNRGRRHNSDSDDENDDTDKDMINIQFQRDVQETGKWGSISRKEIYAVTLLIAAIILGVLIVIVVMVLGSDDSTTNNSNAANVTVALSPALYPTAAPTRSYSQEEAYMTLRNALQSHASTVHYTRSVLPLEYDSLPEQDNDGLDPVVRAALWTVQTVGSSPDPLVTRFALAHMYYSTHGDDAWTNATGWLTPDDSLCDAWHGIACHPLTGHLEEVDLASNGLQGTIPASLGLLSTLRILWLNDNDLSGTIPGEAIAEMSSLFILYVQDNALTGPIPDNLQTNEVLRKFHSLSY
jgi:hypothetical protein